MVSQPDWRVRCAVTLLGLTWTALAGRLIWLQSQQRPQLSASAERQRTVDDVLPARPGEIVDRHGRVLAATITAKSLYVIPRAIDDVDDAARRLAQALQLDVDTLRSSFVAHREHHFLWIKRRLRDQELARLSPDVLPQGAWGLRDEFLRGYPQGRLAAHVIGLRDIDGRGRGGIEESFHRVLCGQPGRRRLTRDSHGRVIAVDSPIDEAPRAGATVRLTLDSVIQLELERQLDDVMETWTPFSACGAVLDPRTGDVLAMASRPDFDPNAPAPDRPDAYRNRVIADIYEPGSTIKPMFVAWGVEHGLLSRDQTIDCEQGEYRMGRRLLHDHHRYGRLSLTDVLVKSSNIGMAKVGEILGNEQLHEALTRFGFGQRTGIELPGEIPGLVRPLERWNGYSTGSIPMGHEFAATPLQLAAAHAALAGGGHMRPPRMTLEPLDSSTARLSQLVVQPETAQWLVEGPMSEVVTRGTGRRARLDDVRVFGKTGTSQVLDPNGGYRHDRYVSSFVCGAPAENPRAIVLIVVNEATVGSEQFGGKVAAPAAAKVLEVALQAMSTGPWTQAETASPRTSVE